MNGPLIRSVLFACGALLLALLPWSVTADDGHSSPVSDLSDDTVRHVLETAGFVASPPAVWSENALMIEAKQADGRTVRAIVYRDAAAAAAAHQQAYAQNVTWTDARLLYSDDVGPPLLSGFGASAWRRNIALVESSPSIFAALMPAEPDCVDVTPQSAPDLARPAYHVGDDLVALFDALPQAAPEVTNT
jgi:hypothetical protein